jgi:transposase-like protein
MRCFSAGAKLGPDRVHQEPSSYRGYRYSAEIISYAVWLYLRFSVSLRDVEELLAERGVAVTMRQR